MNEFVIHSKDKILKMGNRKMKIWEISKLNRFKRSSRSRSNIFQIHLGNSQKEWMKQNQLDDCKVKILENLGGFDILTKESVLNIEKWAFKDGANKRNVPTWAYPLTLRRGRLMLEQRNNN